MVAPPGMFRIIQYDIRSNYLTPYVTFAQSTPPKKYFRVLIEVYRSVRKDRQPPAHQPSRRANTGSSSATQKNPYPPVASNLCYSHFRPSSNLHTVSSTPNLVLAETMAITESGRVMIKRMQAKHRKVRSSKTRTDLHLHKIRPGGKVLTPAEKGERHKTRVEKKEKVDNKMKDARSRIWTIAVEMSVELGNTPEYWHRRLMQNARIAKSTRKPNRWNAYTSIKLEEINAGKQHSYYVINLNIELTYLCLRKSITRG